MYLSMREHEPKCIPSAEYTTLHTVLLLGTLHTLLTSIKSADGGLPTEGDTASDGSWLSSSLGFCVAQHTLLFCLPTT